MVGSCSAELSKEARAYSSRELTAPQAKAQENCKVLLWQEE